MLVQFPQLAAARNQPAGALPRTDHQRAVGLAKIAGQGDEVHGVAVGAGQLQGMFELLDDPGPAEQPGDQRRILRLRLDETIGAAHDARLAGQIGFAVARSPAWRALRPSSCHTKPTRPAKRGAFCAEKLQQLAAGLGDDVLRRGPQGNFDQRGHFHAHAEQIGHQAMHGPQRSGVGTRGPGEHFLHARRHAFLPAMQFFQHGRPLGHAAPPLPQGRQFVVANGQLALVLGKLLLGRLPQFVVRLDVLGQFVALAAKTVEFRGHRGDLPVEVRDAAAAAVAGGRGASQPGFPGR